MDWIFRLEKSSLNKKKFRGAERVKTRVI